MKRLFVQTHYAMFNLDYVASIRIEEEYIRQESGGFTDQRQSTGFWVVHAENIALYKSRLEEKCQEFMMRLGNAVCRSPADAVIIAMKNGKFLYRDSDDNIITIPDRTFDENIDHILRASEEDDELASEQYEE